MEDSGYQANAGDRCEMVTSPHDESPITLVVSDYCTSTDNALTNLLNIALDTEF